MRKAGKTFHWPPTRRRQKEPLLKAHPVYSRWQVQTLPGHMVLWVLKQSWIVAWCDFFFLMCCINKNTLYKDAIQWERGAAANRAAGCGLLFHCLAGDVSWHFCFRYIWLACSAWKLLFLQDWCSYCSREVQLQQRINTNDYVRFF